MFKSHCEHEDREFIVDSGASIHMKRNNELTSSEKETTKTPEDQKNPPSSRPPTEKAESTEEATVCVNDLDVFVTMMLLKYSPAVLSLELLMQRNGRFLSMEKGRVSTVD